MITSLRINLYQAIFLIFICVFGLNSYAHNDEKVVKISSENHFQNGTYNVDLRLNIASDWKLYSHEPGDIGVPLSIKIVDSVNVKSHLIEWPTFKTESELIGDKSFTTKYYEEILSIPMKVIPEYIDKNTNLKLHIDYGVCKDYCLTENQVLDIELSKQPINDSHGYNFNSQLIYILLISLLGGFILNFMPCVLPVLSIKLMGIIKYKDLSKKQITHNLLATAFGIVFSFFIIGIITIIAKNSGQSVGWGFHFQEPAFIMFLAITLMIFSSNLWGDFEIQLPSSFINKLGANNTLGLSNSFLSGAFATLLATPCTFSIISTAVAFAISQGSIEIMLIYFFTGLGMSIPYLLTAAFPNSLKLLPKPGRWMESLKKIFSIILTITVTWLLFVLIKQIHFRSLLIFVGGLILIRLFITKKMTLKTKGAFLIIIILLTFYLPLTLNHNIDDNEAFVASLWEDFDEDKLNEAVKNGKIVLIDFTAEWCVTCKINKFLVFDNPELSSNLKHKGIVLLRADLTGVKTSSAREKSVKYIAFLEKNKRYGIPFNAVYSPTHPEGIKLPSLLSRGDVLSAISQVSKE